MSPLATARVLIKLAVRNFVLHRVKTLIIGTIMFFGAFVFVVGAALLDSVERSMSKSIISSLAGHLQLYAKNAKDELALFGGLIMGAEDIGTIDDFSKVKQAVMAVPNVKAIVPMGIDQCSVTTGNELDRALEALREAVGRGDQAEIAERISRVRSMAVTLESEIEKKAEVDSGAAELEANREKVRRIQTDEFWADLAADPERVLQFLDTEIAPLSEGGLMLYLRYVGTDLELFQQNFDRFEVVEGQMVPPGRKGLLLSQKVYDEEVKHVVARELDALHRAVTKDAKEIAGDAVLEARVKHAVNAYNAIAYQLSPKDALEVEKALAARFPDVKGGLKERLQALLNVDDSNIVERRELFYELIAPKIRLHEFDIGDTITLRTYTRSGYINSANVKLYGTYHFKGLEQSELAGGHNLVDLITFRELYGHMTEAQKAELAHIRSTIEAKEISRESAEDALFGGSTDLVRDVDATGGGGEDVLAKIEEGGLGGGGGAVAADEVIFTREELESGLALNAAVVVEDASRIAETRQAIEKVAEGLGLQVVDWQASSGLIGQFIVVVRGVLFVAVVIIFLVAFVIINNSMVMAMQDRVAEIGTMRAIGAHRWFVLAVFIGESLVLGVIAGMLGVAAGAGTILWLGSEGIPAVDDVTVFLFAGPRFFPSVGAVNVLLSFLLILGIGVISTLYPARIAASIQPVVAMRGKGE